MRTRDEEKIKRLKETAIQMIVDFGFKGLSMQKLASASSMSPATIYIYYRDRDDLLNQLFLEVFNESNEAAIENFSVDMGLEDGLQTIWLNRFRYSIKNPTKALFLDQYINSPVIVSEEEGESNHRKVMSCFYKNLITKGEIDPMSVKVYWSIAFFPLFQLIKFKLQKGIHPRVDEEVDEAMVLECLGRVVKALRP